MQNQQHEAAFIANARMLYSMMTEAERAVALQQLSEQAALLSVQSAKG
ncbi:hypothetical protein [Caballeronia sp. NCTM5]|nr:hypothetical protein [Caballeronia sp. NCTM5]